MRWQQMALGVLAGLAGTLGSMAWQAWDLQRGHRETLLCVRPGMTASQVRHLLGPPRVVWSGSAPFRAAMRAEGAPGEEHPPTGWRRAYIYPTALHTRMVVLLDGRNRTTAVLDYGT